MGRASSSTTTDRELLLVLKEQIDNIRSQVTTLNTRFDRLETREITNDRISNIERSLHDLQTDKLDRNEWQKSDGTSLEERIRTLENFRWWILGAQALASTVTILILHFLPPFK